MEADSRPGAIDLLPAVGQRPVLAGVRQDAVDADRRIRRRGRRQPSRPRTRPPEQRVLRARRQQRALRARARRHGGAARRPTSTARPGSTVYAPDGAAPLRARSRRRCCRRASWSIAAPTLASGLSFSRRRALAVLRRAGSRSHVPGVAPLPLRRRRRARLRSWPATCAAPADRSAPTAAVTCSRAPTATTTIWPSSTSRPARCA